MTLTNLEEKRLYEIERWEDEFFSHVPTDFEVTYQRLYREGFKKLPEKRKQKLLDTVDKFLFYAQSLTLNSRFHQEATERIITQARIFNEEVKEIQDMKSLKLHQLHFIHSQQAAKQRLISLGQGGLSGAGGVLLIGADLPAMLIINLRAVQLTALTFGYDLRKPYEMMLAIKVFHVASLPKGMQKKAWEEVLQEWEEEDPDYPFFYGGKEEVINPSWFQQPLRQVGKAAVITLARKKLIQGIPVAGMLIGATVNYNFSCQVTEVAKNFYEKRYLYEKSRL
ncbi:EcsC family protein [Thalassorhabdus alkalitolerans]|uniref:EcsC family protein n=1 Tax=Thalassorhabdus alkalitolerans TaxID=2282697 RepID=A0ABW0YN98_9BACI